MSLAPIQTDPPYVMDEIPRTIPPDSFDYERIMREIEFGKDPDEEYDEAVEDEKKRGTFLDNIIRELVIRDLAVGNKADEDVGSIMGGPVSYALKAKGNAADMLTKAMGNFGLAKSLI